jgi:DNA helicase-2/ATP-dependent DNA helicase PcrA
MTAFITAEQQAVIQDRSGNLVVEAGPGTGKTETLARRTASLVADGICHPHQIWCASYTRSAARSLHQRLRSLNADCWAVTCGTLHSLALRLVRSHGWRVGQPDVEVMPAADQLSLVTRLAEYHHLPNTLITPRRVLELFALEANSTQTLENLCATPALRPHLGKLLLIQTDALRFRREHRLLDYDDIFFVALEVIQKVKEYIRQYDLCCLLVDEAQDLTCLQLQFIRALADCGVGITAVGDRMQAIYGWRGAAPDVMQQLPQLLPQPVAQLNLACNFRCPQPVVQAAAHLAVQAGAVPQQAVRPGKPVRHFVVPSDRAEAESVVAWIAEHAPQDCAVIYRSSTHALLLESQLKTAGISYRKHGGLRHDDADRKDLAALLRLVIGLHRPSLIRILQTLPSVGKATALKMADQWPDCKVPPKAAERLMSLLTALPAWTLSNIPEYVLPAAAQWLGVELDAALLSQAAASASLRDLLDSIALGAEENEPQQDCLTLCTGHYAKGHEWSHVCVIGCVGGRFVRPAAEEDNRLLYVAMTRAAETLTTFAPLAFRRDDGLFVSGAPLLRPLLRG